MTHIHLNHQINPQIKVVYRLNHIFKGACIRLSFSTASIIEYNGGQCVLFSVVFTPPPPSHHGSVWLLPVVSLLLTNAISRMRAFLPVYIWSESFVGTKTKTSLGLLVFNSSMLCLVEPPPPPVLWNYVRHKTFLGNLVTLPLQSARFLATLHKGGMEGGGGCGCL